MALRTLLRHLRPKVQTFSGDCVEGSAQFESILSTVAKRATTWNIHRSISVHTLNAERPFWQRGYSSEPSLVDTDNGCTPLDSPSCGTPGETNSPNQLTTSGVNLGPKISERHNLAMIFTCTVCQTRSAKTMSRQTYEKGVVIVRCGGCKNLHLIADRLGWFGEPGSVEDFLQQKGVEIRKGSEESYEFTMEDLAGWTPPSHKE